jgi:ATP-binding cassette subfamily A (ABC1) protein 3
MNYIFTLSQMARFPLAGFPVNMLATTIPSPDPQHHQSYYVPIWVFWLLLGVHIFVYPVLAVVAEHAIHGINKKGRAQIATEEPGNPNVAIRTTGLVKVYPTWRKRWFGIREPDRVPALDGLNLVAQKHQILCLLGINGAGKSTTLEILSGVRRQTSGEVAVYAPPSKLGMPCASTKGPIANALAS